MPTYEYRCLDCDEAWERREHIDEHEELANRTAAPPPCPGCESERVEPVLSGFFAKTGRKS
ncbi:MAG: zinc ribbon domain-containing protein [Gemmatimonadetes bacterium]|nr:zinc ribbon domain-containing protein [Gemmatimonadota bacterium]